MMLIGTTSQTLMLPRPAELAVEPSALTEAERRERERRRPPVVRLFWVRTLRSLVSLYGGQLVSELPQLAKTRLRHPIDGWRTFTPDELSRELREADQLVRIVDQVFWMYALEPFIDLPADEQQRALDGLQTMLLNHPLSEPRRYPRSELARHLQRARQTDRKAVDQQLVDLLGPFVERRAAGSPFRYANGYALATRRLGLSVAKPW